MNESLCYAICVYYGDGLCGSEPVGVFESPWTFIFYLRRLIQEYVENHQRDVPGYKNMPSVKPDDEPKRNKK